MRDSAAQPPPPVSVLGWLLVALRMFAMLALLLCCLPLHGVWRLLRLDRFWPRMFLGGVAWIAGLRVKRHGRPVPGALLLANHVSWMDVPALAHAAASAFVAHDGLAASPLLRFLCRLNETVFIARHDRRSITRQVSEVRAAIDNGGTLTLFPEGTTGNGTGLLPFKSALLSAVSPLPDGVAVQPVLLDYADAPGIAWAGEEAGFDNFIRITARLAPIRLALHFLPPLEGEALRDRKTMAAAAQAAIAQAMKRPQPTP